MADEPQDALDIIARALTRSTQSIDDILSVPLCDAPGCTRVATRPDKKCYRHTAIGLTADEIEARRREIATRLEIERLESAYTSESNRQLAESNAALKGDSRPAEWNLLHTGVVKPVAKETGGAGSITVQVGVILPGLPGYDPGA